MKHRYKIIEELVEQAIISVDIVTGNEPLDGELAKMYIPDCFAEKFAELIIEECLRLMEIRKEIAIDYECGVDETLSTLKTEIEEHFGVKE